jgi:hypothetical protein
VHFKSVARIIDSHIFRRALTGNIDLNGFGDVF